MFKHHQLIMSSTMFKQPLRSSGSQVSRSWSQLSKNHQRTIPTTYRPWTIPKHQALRTMNQSWICHHLDDDHRSKSAISKTLLMNLPLPTQERTISHQGSLPILHGFPSHIPLFARPGSTNLRSTSAAQVAALEGVQLFSASVMRQSAATQAASAIHSWLMLNWC